MKVKINKKTEKHYIYVNIIILLLTIYVMFFPFISRIITTFIPQLGICPYLAITGNPCPFCGGTRYIAGLGQVFKNPAYLLNPFGIMIICIILEMIFRIIILLRRKNLKNINRIIKYDIIIHTILLIILIVYEVLFLGTG